ncbi:conjugative transposon protein TraM [Tunicatimonas pelagia]|uniref:conjugative transposon protein TraM n=1 Tax=Tunicatimonas pelagia TaxID=931531 RepID=UPI00266665C0|nr:conjugative transposon protein TraM [Tunicatimonas pelagia]WKN46480.1 conjugative transposon protein TraM [Tunicatimonas pelagia]
MDRVEQVEHPERFQQGKPPLWKRAQTFVVNNIFWIPIVGIVVGVVGFYMLYGYYSGKTVRLNVDLGDYVEPRQEKPGKEISKFEEALNAIKRKNNVKSRDRYEKAVNGRDIISTDYGHLTYFDDGNEEEEEVLIDTATVDTTAAPVKVVKVYIPAASPPPVDTTSVDTVEAIPQIRNPFASVRLASSHEVRYIPAFIYGDQTIGRNSRVKLQLGETLSLDNHKINKGTIFFGRARLTNDAIYVSVNRIGRYDVSYDVYDNDYSHGILLENPKNGDTEQALTQSAYRSSNRGVADIPYDIARDVARAIVINKRRRQREVRLSDGDPVFLAKNQ